MSQVDQPGNRYSSPAALENQTSQSSETGKLLLRTIKYASFTLVLLVLLHLFNIVGFTYFRRVDNQPLQNPVRVVRNSNEELELADGRLITNFWDGDLLANAMRRTGSNEVEIAPSEIRPDGVDVMTKDHQFICGIGGPMITIPLIPQPVPRYKRVRIGRGVVAESKPVGPGP
jgi:hypothetical protein